MKQKEKVFLSVKDAMDNLSAILQMDMEGAHGLGLKGKARLIVQEEDVDYKGIEWLAPDNASLFIEAVRESYLCILQYIKDKILEDRWEWKDKESQRGIQELMVMVSESADKLDHIFSLFPNIWKVKKVTELKEYRDLRDFYHTQIESKFVESELHDEAWHEEWDENEDALLLDVEETGLKDFESVKQDEEYELFYLHDEEGNPFFSKDLLRSIKLACAFDESGKGVIEEDPILRISFMLDRDAQAAANQIVENAHGLSKKFYQEHFVAGQPSLAMEVSKALMALFLSANPKNLLQNTSGKSCKSYFNDFVLFLKKTVLSEDYQLLLTYPQEHSDVKSKELLAMIHQLAYHFFTRIDGVREEMIGFIHLLIGKGERLKKKKPLIDQILWERILEKDDHIRSVLNLYPNGPLFKVLDVIHEEEKEDLFPGFEPIAQGNFPAKIYELEGFSKRVQVLRIPSPTKQEVASTAVVAEEMLAFLRGTKHLFINFQDRTSWKELARCRVLEDLSKRAEFKDRCFVVTLPKKGDFYHQKGIFLGLNHAKDFIVSLEDEIDREKDSAFFFSPQIKKKDLKEWVSNAVVLIHNLFFQGKNVLSQKERKDFIEVFYQFLLIKLLELCEPETVSFTCKDGVDIGAAHGAGFYGFMRLLAQKPWNKQEEDFLLWLFYGPSFLIRERAIHCERLTRTLSALAIIDGEMAEHHKKIIQRFSVLYKKDFLEKISAYAPTPFVPKG